MTDDLRQEVLLRIIMEGRYGSPRTEPSVDIDEIVIRGSHVTQVGNANVLLQFGDLIEQIVLRQISHRFSFGIGGAESGGGGGGGGGGGEGGGGG